jgi:hypothetical protein
MISILRLMTLWYLQSKHFRSCIQRHFSSCHLEGLGALTNACHVNRQDQIALEGKTNRLWSRLSRTSGAGVLPWEPKADRSRGVAAGDTTECRRRPVEPGCLPGRRA